MGGWRKIKLDIPVAKLVSAVQVNMDIPVDKASAAKKLDIPVAKASAANWDIPSSQQPAVSDQFEDFDVGMCTSSTSSEASLTD